MIVVRCPSCGAKLTAPRVEPGRMVDCPKCGQSMTLPTDTAAAETVAAPPGDPDTTRTAGGGGHGGELGPVHVPGYEVLEELGRGGMGVVYKARQFSPPRVVALKMVLAGEHATPEQLARFRAEAEATARLTHPAIAQIHQVGEWHPDGGGPPVPFLTLEYVDGRSLAKRLAEGPRVTFRQAADLVRRLARATHYAHQQGVLHRDLKPGNVLLTGGEGPDSLGEPKIVDFGLAKPLDGFATLAAGHQTQSGAVLGTPSYMAPEQARGKGKVGPATDVWALGAILYELLTGRPPFTGDSTVDTLIRVANEDPEPPRRLRPKVPRDLETVCLTCLAKDPDRRYPSAAALAQDLGRFLDGEPVRVRPPSRLERLGRWARRRKEALYLAGGAGLALAVVVAVLLARPAAEKTDPGSAGTPRDTTNPGPPPEDSPIAESRRRMTSLNNLKQIALGLHNLHDATGEFPPAAITDKAGKPLLSWRVALLPYIEQEPLYKQFKLDEPWDSPNNKPLIEKMPPTFAVEGKSAGPPGTTHYQAVVGKGTVWEPLPQFGGSFGRRGLSIPAITDGTSNTILVVEAADPVVWTRPDDAALDGGKLPRLGGVVKNGFNVAMADGSVRFVHQTVDPVHLRNALVRSDGLVLPSDWENGTSADGASAEVTGRVTYQGKPVAGGFISFQRSGILSGGGLGVTLRSDGTYRVSLKPGTYEVTVGPPQNPPPDFPKLPPRYANSDTSPLRAVIQTGRQQLLDYDLTDGPPTPKGGPPGAPAGGGFGGGGGAPKGGLGQFGNLGGQFGMTGSPGK